MYFYFGLFVGNTILLHVTESMKNAVSSHCDTHNIFFNTLLQSKCQNGKVEEDSEQNLVEHFDEFKINNRNLQCFKRKNIPPVS